MNTQNLEYLKDALKYRGFPQTLNGELEKYMKDTTPVFELNHRVKTGEDEMAFKLHFSKHKVYDFYYFNKFEASLLEKGQAQEKVHTFYPDQNVTAREAYNLLKYGERTAVNKNLFDKEGRIYNAWVTLDLNGEKDKHNNYPLLKYHENYYAKRPFRLEEAMNDLAVPVKESEESEKMEPIMDALRKGTPAAITISNKGKESQGYLMVNAKAGQVEVYNRNMELIPHKSTQHRKQQADTSSEEDNQEQNREEKKKPWQNQRVSQRRNSKGRSI